MTRTSQPTRPRGRDQIVAAVVVSATALFAERGPRNISLREIAARANVTLSQIHRHIGNKEALLAAVLADELESNAVELGVAPDGLDLGTFLRALIQLDLHADADVRTRLQARIILDGYDLASLQHRYPGIELAVALLQRDVADPDARVRAAMFASFVAGWRLLGSGYLRVTGASDVTPEHFAEIVAPVIDAMAAAPSRTG